MFGRMHLRTQLLATYILLLIISLSVISGAVMVLSGTRPAPVESSYDRFASIMQGLGVRNFLSNVGQIGGRNDRTARMDEMVEQMDRYAEYSDVRVMWAFSGQNGTTVLFDSMDVYESGTSIVLQVDEDYTEDRELQTYLTRNSRQ